MTNAKENLFVTVSSIVASKISQPMHPPACKKNPPVPTVCAQYRLYAFVLNSGWSIISSPYRSIRDSKGPKRPSSLLAEDLRIAGQSMYSN